MPFGGNKFELRKMVPYKEMLKTIDKKFPMIVKLKDLPSDTSKVLISLRSARTSCHASSFLFS